MSDLDKFNNLFSSPDGYESSKSKKDFSHYLASSGEIKRLANDLGERGEWLDSVAMEISRRYREREDVEEGFIFTPFSGKSTKASLTYTNLDVEDFGAATCAQICAYCRTHNVDLIPFVEAIEATCKKLWEDNDDNN